MLIPGLFDQHFTVSDLEKMRVQEEIAGMPNYAEECPAFLQSVYEIQYHVSHVSTVLPLRIVAAGLAHVNLAVPHFIMQIDT